MLDIHAGYTVNVGTHGEGWTDMMSDTSPEQPLDSMLSPRSLGQLPLRGGYMNRFKFQRERLRHLQTFEDHYPKSYPIKKTLPKLLAPPHLERDDTNVSSISAKSIETIKLPTVPSHSRNFKMSHYIKHTPPIRTVHLRLYPDLFSRIAQSLPSLPSIPGSPGPLQVTVSPLPCGPAPVHMTPGTSPDREAAPEPLAKPLVIPSRHRYEVIAFQKTIHSEKSENGVAMAGIVGGMGLGADGFVKYQKHQLYHLDESPRKDVAKDDRTEEDSSPMIIKAPIRYRRRVRTTPHRHGDLRGDGTVGHKKWKDDCGCLRCQMIKRHWSEGDAMYKLWGEYPCQHIDPKAVADDARK